MGASVRMYCLLGAALLTGTAASATADEAAGLSPVMAPAAHYEGSEAAPGIPDAVAPPLDSGQFPESDYALDASEIYDMSEMPPHPGLEHLRTQFASGERPAGALD